MRCWQAIQAALRAVERIQKSTVGVDLICIRGDMPWVAGKKSTWHLNEPHDFFAESLSERFVIFAWRISVARRISSVLGEVGLGES